MLTINNLFNNENFKIKSIVIPEIQRDYVQGLEEYSYKLNNFLDVLFNALSSKDSKDMCSLDFIYGNIDTNGVFEPIDGQQRITTLALLYYYIEVMINKNYDNNIFKHISYKTKKTATDFCTLLDDKDFIDYLSNNKNMDINNAIKDYYKYYDIYNYDLTIESMINTLHLIQKKYKDISNISFENITFNIFPMESFKLSDDLYIKMNGRGKQLSSFDNFKADYFKWLEEVCNNDNIDNLIPNSIESDKCKKLETLKRKFNTDYIDIFWDYAFENSKGTSEAPDPEKLFFRFINRFIVGKYLLIGKNDEDFEKTFIDKGIKSEEDAVIFNDIDLYTKILNENDDYKNYTYNYKMINILENLSNLQKYYSCKFNNILNFIFNPLWKDEKLNIFPKENGLTYKHVLIFNAITSFLEQDSIIIDNIKCDDYNKIEEIFINENNLSIHEECENNILMTLKRISRIVWNITEQYNLLNTISKDNYKTVISRLDFSKLAKVENIYNKFQNICDSKGSNNQNENNNNNEDNIDIIIKDEIKKCQFLYDANKVDISLEQMFINLERLPYLKGTIGFLLGENKDDFINISSEDNILNDAEFIKLLVYTIFDNNKDFDILFNKLFDDISIHKYLIIEDIFKSNAYSILKEKPAMPDKYEDFIKKYINNYDNNLRDAFKIYCIAALLYFKDRNTKEYIINTHFIDTTKFPCIMENDYKKYAYYGLYKRFSSIIVEQNICNLIEKITQNKSIIYNENNADVHIIKFDMNNNEYNTYKHLIYGNDGTIMLFLKIHDIKYTLWFLYNPEEYTFGLTDETDTNNKIVYKMNYVKEKFVSDLENIINCIQELANDRDLTLSEYMKKNNIN